VEELIPTSLITGVETSHICWNIFKTALLTGNVHKKTGKEVTNFYSKTKYCLQLQFCWAIDHKNVRSDVTVTLKQNISSDCVRGKVISSGKTHSTKQHL